MLAALLGYAMILTFAAVVAWQGVRRTPDRPLLGVLATACVVALTITAWQAFGAVSAAMEAYAVGDPMPGAPGNLWAFGSLAVVVKYAPLWLLGRG